MLGYFIGLLGPALQTIKMNNESLREKSEALSALKEALRFTKKHISETRMEDIDDIESKSLSKKWSKAAKLIRPFDSSLAIALESKGDYWLDPRQFKNDIQNNSRRFDYRFRIDEVEKSILDIEAKWNRL